MEKTNETCSEPKYTMDWLGIRVLLALGLSLVLMWVANGIDWYAHSRIRGVGYELISQSTAYCFGVVAITSMSLTLVEVVFRKVVNYVQYGLIDCALGLFYLLLLAMAEQMPFWAAYSIVSVMTTVLIVWFVNGITKKAKAAVFAAVLLVVEYGLVFVLVYVGAMALLVGSLLLFLLIAIAMYFTLKLKVENGELVLK